MMKWFRNYFGTKIGVFLVIVCILAGLAGCREGVSIAPPPQSFGATLNSTLADTEPRLNYDGRYLVFSSDRLGQRGVFLYDVQNRSLIDLPGINQAPAIHDQPDISADGRYIVYISEERGKPDVFLYDRQTMQSEAISEDIVGEVRHPSISGNGRLIAFESNRSGQWHIEIYDRGSGVELSLPHNDTAGDRTP